MKGSPAKSMAMPARLRAAVACPVPCEPESLIVHPAINIPPALPVLLGEVLRIEGELAAVRAKMKELETTADIDAVTGFFNRRGFDRELARTLAYVRRYGTRA